jgi:hypothetical protein
MHLIRVSILDSYLDILAVRRGGEHLFIGTLVIGASGDLKTDRPISRFPNSTKPYKIQKLAHIGDLAAPALRPAASLKEVFDQQIRRAIQQWQFQPPNCVPA